MREIRFRAKRLDNGEWAYSKTIATNAPLDGSDDRWFIGAGQPADQYVNKNGNMIAVETTGECLFYAIDPETVGQFTGLTDKNGKKIFEGDIIRVGGDIYACRWDEGNVEFGLSSKRESFGIAYAACPCMEVIGNIHDNLELLAEDWPCS